MQPVILLRSINSATDQDMLKIVGSMLMKINTAESRTTKFNLKNGI